jgi:hydrogenase expression/formation protein HypC
MCLGIPGKVTEVYERHGIQMGRVDFEGVVKEICLAYVPDIQPGEYTLVHVGFGISKVDEESARETLKLFSDLGSLEEELGGKAGGEEAFVKT